MRHSKDSNPRSLILSVSLRHLVILLPCFHFLSTKCLIRGPCVTLCISCTFWTSYVSSFISRDQSRNLMTSSLVMLQRFIQMLLTPFAVISASIRSLLIPSYSLLRAFNNAQLLRKKTFLFSYLCYLFFR